MNACGNIRTATLFASALALATSNSEIHGDDRTSRTRLFARMSSTAVIDHSVGTSRRRSFVPSRPTENTRVIWLWEIPWSYRSVTASPARRSVSETRSSTRRGTDGFEVSSTFARSALGPLGGARTENGLTRDGFFVNHISVSIGLAAIAASCTAERIEAGARASATRRGAFPRTSVSRHRRISGSSYESHGAEAATSRRTRERSWSGGGGGRHLFRGRRRRGRFLFDDLVPALIANWTNVDDAARCIARLGAMDRAVVLLRHLIPPKDPRHLWFSGSVQSRIACRGSPRVGRSVSARTRRRSRPRHRAASPPRRPAPCENAILGPGECGDRG